VKRTEDGRVAEAEVAAVRVDTTSSLTARRVGAFVDIYTSHSFSESILHHAVLMIY